MSISVPAPQPPWGQDYAMIMTILEPFLNSFLKELAKKTEKIAVLRGFLVSIDPPSMAKNLVVFLATCMTPELLERCAPRELEVAWSRDIIIDIIDEMKEEPSLRDLWKKCTIAFKKYKIDKEELEARPESEDSVTDEKAVCTSGCPYHC